MCVRAQGGRHRGGGAGDAYRWRGCGADSFYREAEREDFEHDFDDFEDREQTEAAAVKIQVGQVDVHLKSEDFIATPIDAQDYVSGD